MTVIVRTTVVKTMTIVVTDTNGENESDTDCIFKTVLHVMPKLNGTMTSVNERIPGDGGCFRASWSDHHLFFSLVHGDITVEALR